MPTSTLLFGATPAHAGAAPASAPSTPPTPPGFPRASAGSSRDNTLTVIGGVGVLLLAMGVGVLIGRAGGAKESSAPAQVITVSSPGSSSGTGEAAAASAFAGDWPSGTDGYTVQLQTLQPGTTVAAVEAAKTSASAKGAKSVGALKSEEFASLTGSDYVIYSGVYTKQPEAQKALGALRKSFPGAKVIKVSNAGSGSGAGSAAGGGSSSSTGAGSSESHPAPPSVLKTLEHAKGKSYEEKSKNLPDVVSTG